MKPHTQQQRGSLLNDNSTYQAVEPTALLAVHEEYNEGVNSPPDSRPLPG